MTCSHLLSHNDAPLPSLFCTIQLTPTTFQTEEIPQFNIAVVGHRGVGKTTFIKAVLTGECVLKYDPTPADSDPRSGVFYTTGGPLKLSVQETATNNPDCSDKHVQEADGVIVMFNASSHDAKEADKYWENALDGLGDIPVALCWNKMDLEKCPIKPEITRCPMENRSYHYLSAKTGKYVHMPFLWFARMFKGDNNLMFVEAPAVQPPEYTIDEEARQRLEEEIARAQAQLLPDDDDDDEL